MQKRTGSIAMIVILLVYTIITNVGLTFHAQAETDGEGLIKSVTMTNEEGEQVDDISAHEGETVDVHYSWEITEEADNSTYVINVPEGTLVLNEQTGTLSAGENDEIELGTYTVSKEGSITVKLNEVEKEEESEDTDDTDEPRIYVGEFVVEVGVEESNDSRVVSLQEEAKQITENIIDELKLFYEDGTKYQDGDFIEIGEDLRLELDWSLPNDHNYKSGDYFEFQLPNQLQVYNEITGELGEYGSYVVTTEGEVTFTFNDRIENESNVKGEFWFDTELDEQEIKTTTEDLEITYNNDVLEKITINVKPIDGQAIHKEGQPVGGDFNTEEIEWTVLVNTTRDALKNAIVNDPIFKGLELDLNSIELQEVEVDISGKVTKELDVVTDYTNNSTEEELNIALGDTNKAYKLTFKTKMKEEEKDNEGWKGYPNTVYLNSDGQDEKESAASVSVNRPESMTKTSSKITGEHHAVQWTVNANFTQKNLEKGDTITDTFTFTVGQEDKSELFEVTDIKIWKVDSFKDNGEVDEKTEITPEEMFDIQINGNEVTYTLKEDTNKAFIIKYKTKPKQDAYITHNGTISNSVKIDGEPVTSSQGIIQQVGKKGNDGIDYENKTIDWTITINADKQDLRNFVLTDDFSGSGQKLVVDSIKISPEKQGVTPNLNPVGIPEGEGFVINFGDITETYTITYQTEFTYDFEGERTPNFNNKVDISYKTKDGEDYDLVIRDNVNPNEQTKGNGAKNGTANNETKEITWTVDINYNQLELEDAKLIDEIAENQTLVDGSVKIYPTTIDKNGNIIAGEATDKFTVNTDNDVINIEFGEIDQSYRIEFMTKDEDGVYNSDEVYENTAQFIPREGEKHNLTAEVELPNQGKFIGKEGFHDKENWTIDWKIDVNESKSKIKNVTVKDDLGSTDSQILLEDTIKVTKAGSDKELVEGEDYDLDVGGNKFSVNFPGEITEHYIVTYSSYIVAESDVEINNKAEIQSVDITKVNTTETTETVSVKFSTGGGTGQGETGGLTIEKFESGSNRALEGIKFNLVKTVGSEEIVVREGTTNADGKLEWAGLKYGEYTLVEIVPSGYDGPKGFEKVESSKENAYSKVITISSEEMSEGIQTFKIENARQIGTAKIVKVDALTGAKLANAEFEITDKTTGQKYTLTTKANGEIAEDVPFGEYTVEEVTAPEGYRINKDIDNITVEIGETTEVTVTNEAIVEVAGEKTWIIDEDQELPESIKVELLADDSKVDEKEVTAADDWTYSFTNLDKYDAEGNEIEYSIEEIELDGYVSKKDGYDLINIQAINISGEKMWIEVDENHRPDSITVILLANEAKVKDKTVRANDKGEWTFEFENLPKFDLEGYEIDYTLKEVDVNGYTSEVKDLVITNTQNTTEISGEKIWQDNNDATGDRPESITVQVMNGEVVVKDQEVTAQDNWKYTFTELPTHDKEGKEIEYTVAEKEVPEGYVVKPEIKEDDEGIHHNLINTRTGTTEISGEKIWQDNNDATGDRPDSITVHLLQNDVVYKTIDELTPNEDGEWVYTFTELPQFDAEGKEYSYTIDEGHVEGYTLELNGTNLINTRSGITEVSGEKIWKDADASDRPEYITVNLLQNGEEILSETISPDAEGNWTYSFTGLQEFDDNGVAWAYTVEEEPVEGYATSAGEGHDLINTRTGTTEVSGEKTWIDEDESDRPKSITVNLFRNDTFLKDQEVTEGDNGDWLYHFTGLPAFDSEGQPFIYTVSEHDVPGYASVVDGFDITNTRADFKTIEITKEWIDGNSDDRPQSIEVELYRSIANGNKELVDTFTVTAENRWVLEITDLPSFDEDGKAYMYEIEEVPVDGYESTINGFHITNLRAELTSVEGTKTWVGDNEANRPTSIKVNLLQNGEKIAEVTVTAETDWTYSFIDLPAFDENGVAYEYIVEEQEVAGYESTVEGYDIKNTFIPEESDDGKDIPKTATNMFNYLLVGLALLIGGAGVLFFSRKPRRNN